MAYLDNPDKSRAIHFYTKQVKFVFDRCHGKFSIGDMLSVDNKGDVHREFGLTKVDVIALCQLVIDKFGKDDLFIDEV